MSSGAYFQTKKSEVSELRTLLKNVEVQKDQVRYRQVVQKVIAYMTLGIDVSSLYPEMVMASATNDLVQKKLVYLYICDQAESNRELAVMMICKLLKDASDDNPMIRGLALRSMCDLRLHDLLDYVKKPILDGLQDKSSYVRKIAVLGFLKIFRFAPSVAKEMNIQGRIMGMINDSDGQVFSNSIFALDEILEHEGGIELNRGLVQKIIGRLHNVSEWAQCSLMEILSRYKPDSDEEIIAFLNNLDDRLKHANRGVVMATAKLFVIFTKDSESLGNDVYKRLLAPLLTLVSATSPELAYSALSNLSSLYVGRSHLLADKYKTFFLRGNEPSFLKDLKLKVLTEIVNQTNFEAILSELRYYAMDVDTGVATNAIKSVGKIGTNYQFATVQSLEILVALLDLDLDHITAHIFDSMKDLLSKRRVYGNDIVSNISSYWDKATDHPSGKAALIWILGEFGEGIPNSPYMLESIVENLEQEQCSGVKLELLNAAMKLFFQRPPEFQNVLGIILEHLTEHETNMDVRDRAVFYYRCLRNDVEKALALLTKSRTLTEESADTLQTKPTLLSEAFLEDFNTLRLVSDCH